MRAAHAAQTCADTLILLTEQGRWYAVIGRDALAMIHHATDGFIVIAAQHLFGGAPWHSKLDSLPIFCARTTRQARREGAIMETATTHDVDVLVGEAFEKSWRFVRTDPILAHGDPETLRAHLSRRLQQLAQDGERDVWRLANGAIAVMRRELTVA